MNPVQLISGAIAGLVGAAIWAAIVYYAKVEIGYVAWGIGGLVGVAVAVSGKNSTLAGIVAVAITIVSLLLGKYAAVEIQVNDSLAGFEEMVSELGLDDELTDDDFQRLIGNQIAGAREAAGKEVNWPEVSEDEERGEAIFPANIWKEAGRKLQAMSAEEKKTMGDKHIAGMKTKVKTLRDAVAADAQEAVEEGFFASFSPFDLLFFGLAIATSWKIASSEE